MFAVSSSVLAGVLFGQSYTNVAALQGLDIELHTDNYGSGVSFFDFDEDGWDDLMFAMGNDSLVIYRNVEGTLVRLPSPLYLAGITKHTLWVDFDNDGDHDLLVTTFGGRHRLYRNEGGLQFTDISAAAGLLQFDAKNAGASFGDFDNDGLLDLYVCTYESEGDPSMYERLNHLYRNNGDGTFTDVTLASGTDNGIGFSFQGCWLDYDHDGDQDLYIINDRVYSNTLYRNNGDGTFTDVSVQTGTDLPLMDPMTVTVGDFDNDGDLDIYMTNTGSVPEKHNLLLRANGDGTYTESAQSLGLAELRWSWGAVWTDLDNNGRLDLHIATGFIDQPLNNNIYKRQIDGNVFVNVTPLLGQVPTLSFACATGDLNNDGYADIVVHNLEPANPYLWLHDGTGGGHIKVTPRGTRSNRMAVGTWVRVYAGGLMQTKYTFCGQDYLSQSSQHLLFGLGSASVVDSVVVTYLSGHTDRYYGLPASTHLWSVEGDTYTASLAATGALAFCAGGSVELSAGTHDAYLWNTGATSAALLVTGPGNYWCTVSNTYGVQTVTDTLVVEVWPVPDLLITSSNPLCHGEATGSITLDNLSGVPPAQVTWSSGDLGSGIDGLAAGPYSYLFEDINGCTVQGSVLLTEPAALDMLISSAPETQGNDGMLELLLFGGTPPYTIALNGLPGSLVNTGLPNGVYTVLVTDANGCTLEQEALIPDHTGIGERTTAAPRVWPNPTGDLLYWSSDFQVQRLQLTDALGRPLMEGNGALGTLSLGWLPAGRYLLRLETTRSVHHIAVVKE